MVISGKTRVGPYYRFAVFDLPSMYVVNSYKLGSLCTVFPRIVFRKNLFFFEVEMCRYFHIVSAVTLLLCSKCCGNCLRVETIHAQKLFREIRYLDLFCILSKLDRQTSKFQVYLQWSWLPTLFFFSNKPTSHKCDILGV